MPTLKEEILILLKEGFFDSSFRSLPGNFKMGTPYKPGSYYNAIRRLTEEGHIEKYRTERKKDPYPADQTGEELYQETSGIDSAVSS